MNEKKKGFNLFPEYVWMIFVGMLLAILILSNVIPGHAGEITPVAGTNSIGFSYESPDHPEYVYTCPFYSAVMVDSQGYYNWLNPPASVFASDDYGVNYYSVINSTSFSNDVKLIKGSVGSEFSGTSLIHVSKANFTGYLPGSVQESWYEDFQEAGYTYFGCDLWAFPSDDISYTPECIGYMIIKFSDNEIPVLSKVNRVFNTELFQVDFDESKVVETLTYFNNKAWIVWGFDFPSDADFWASGRQVIYDGLYDHSVENHRIYVKTVNRGDFYFDHVSYYEQYALNYKYRVNVDCLDLHRVSDPEEPTPTPGLDTVSFYVRSRSQYFLIDIEGSGLGNPYTGSYPDDSMFTYVESQFPDLAPPFVNSPFIAFNKPSNDNRMGFVFYIPFESLDGVYYYTNDSDLSGSDFDFIRNNYQRNTATSNSYIAYTSYRNESGNSILAVYVYIFGDYGGGGALLNPGNIPNLVYKDSINGLYNDIGPFSDFHTDSASATMWYWGLSLGLSDYSSPTPSPTPSVSPSPSPDVSPTSEPLPTSGESIHVILPTGTPTPTPPFTVSGGSDGGSGSGSGSGSPGSIGSGLSSGQTSGVLQAWQLYVSDNPAMLFLTSTFQSLPQELLYPLYILLFILLLLAVIRLFVHFSGG